MKIKAILFAMALSAVSVFGQGLVTFQNSSISTPIFTSPGVRMAAGGNAYSFQFLYGTSAGDLNNSSAVFFNHDSTDGRITTTGTADLSLAIPGGTPAFFQLRAWNSSAGSFANAQTGGTWYQSDIITLTPSISPAPATTMFGPTVGQQFQGFTMVPEPSTFALGALGIGALLMVRRRKV